MKAVIVEIKGSFAAALSDDGSIVKVKNNNFSIGQVIVMKKTGSISKKSIISIATAACIVLALGIGGYQAYAYYKTPTSYISLDINPSVELGVNALDKVVTVENTNEDGDTILQDVNVINNDAEDAVNKLVDSAIDNSFVSEDGTSVISVTVESNDQTDATQTADQLEDSINTELGEKDTEAIVYKDCSDLSFRTEAKELGVSPGKLKHIKFLQSLDPTITVDEYKDVKVSDIMKKAHELIKANGTDTEDTDDSAALNEDTVEKVTQAAEKVAQAEEKAAEKKAAAKAKSNGKANTGNDSETVTSEASGTTVENSSEAEVTESSEAEGSTSSQSIDKSGSSSTASASGSTVAKGNSGNKGKSGK